MSKPAAGSDTDTMWATSSCAVPAPVTTSLEAQRARLGRRGPADREQRQLARLAAQGVRFQGAQGVAAGGDQRLHAVEVDRVGVVEGDAEQRLDGRLVAVLLQHGPELERVRLGAGDEQAHRLDGAEEVGPGSGEQLGGGVLGELERLLRAAFAARGVALAAVGGEDRAAEDETAAGKLGEAGDRRAARAVELGEKGALGRDGERGRLMVDGREQLRPCACRRRGSRRRWRPGPRRAASRRSIPAR